MVLALYHVVEDEIAQLDPPKGEDPPQCVDGKCIKLIEMPILWKNVGREA